MRGKLTPKLERVCRTCGKVFYLLPCKTKNGMGHYCCLKCRPKGQRKIRSFEVKCIICNNAIKVYPSRPDRKYCSKKCEAIGQTGTKNPLKGHYGVSNSSWKDGRSKNPEHRKNLRKAGRQRWRARKIGNGGTFSAIEWATLKKRYGYSCAICNKKEPEIKLSVDHIIPLTKNGDNFITNIQPLCLSCNSKKRDKILERRAIQLCAY